MAKRSHNFQPFLETLLTNSDFRQKAPWALPRDITGQHGCKQTQYKAELVEMYEIITLLPKLSIQHDLTERLKCSFIMGSVFDPASGIKIMFDPAQCHHQDMCTSMWLGRKKGWAALNKQALCCLCDSVEPTKWEQISQDSSESIRGFTQFFLPSTISCSRLMSSGFERFWHFRFNRNWHANKHAQIHTHTQLQTCFARVNTFWNKAPD